MSIATQQNGAVALPSSSAASAAEATANANAGKPTAAPSEVGWLFVPQYYTFLNNDPSKLHCFYSKRSTLVHGTEQQEVPLCFGQQQIHEKIVSLGFSDAKVYVSNVDSQASASGGIVIQVLGEMSNKGGPWRKFAQTFFLAEQPNGYFVLNDIFRYLKEDDDVEDEGAQDAADQSVSVADAPAVTTKEAAPVQQPSLAASAQESTQQAAAPAAADVAEPVDAVTAAQNEGILKPQEPTPASADEVGVDKKVTAVERDQAPVQTKGEVEAAEAASQVVNENAATPALDGASQAPKEEPAPAPSGPKTWANLAAANATRWGTTVNSESRGISSIRENAAAPQPSAARPSATTNGPAGARSSSNGNAYSSARVFIKNVVTENMPSEGLQAALEAKFGPMKECQVVPAKAVAFAEFGSVDAARKAIQQSLPTSQGGEGGIKIGKNGWAVIVEEKRKPAERSGAPSSGAPASSGAGRGGRGGSSAANGQGSARGGRGTGRGGAAGRGNRGGATA